MEKTIVEKHFPDSKQVALYTQVTVPVADFIDKISELGISKRSVVDYAFQKLMEIPIQELLGTLLIEKAKAIGLIETSNTESSPDSEVKD